MYLVSDYIRSAGGGTCYVCHAHRRSHDEIVLDFESDIDFEGALQVCAPCIKEAAGLTGAIAEATDLLRQELDHTAKRLADAEVALAAADTAIDALNLYTRKARPAPDEA